MGRKAIERPPFKYQRRREMHEALDVMFDKEFDGIIVLGKMIGGGVGYCCIGDKRSVNGALHKALNLYEEGRL